MLPKFSCFGFGFYVFIAGNIFAQQPIPKNFEKDGVYSFVQRKPEFGCDSMDGKKLCNQKSLNRYLATNVKYPANGINGNVILEFIVRTNGNIPFHFLLLYL